MAKKNVLKLVLLTAGLFIFSGVLLLASREKNYSGSAFLENNYYPAKPRDNQNTKQPFVKITADTLTGSERIATVQIGPAKITAEIAQNETAVQKGLSGRKYLNPDRGMLFIFAQPDFYRFWMPDMNFPIDIIWIHNERVAAINENVSNKFNPARPVFYTPPLPVKYVLEVNANFAKNKNIRVGDRVSIIYLK